MTTDEFKRPDPDELLAQIEKDEQQTAHGKLKIFLGYVAGVGKTFAMLEAAHQRKDEGVDVVVGYVETHGRKETEALLPGLEVLPLRQVDYRGTNLIEMDLDAVLVRHPQLVLVDELAHTNAPGSRHPKRYQDVEEILNAGIDVYTAVNIQHLESLKDVIQQITGVVVHETVPDSLVDEAYEIELIDLPTDELLQRLRSGKVYVPDQAARALEKFFRKGNLTALRELSLRRAADRVDVQMVDYMQARAIPGPWPAGERILVCLSSHPMGERLIRTGRRLADDLNADWVVMFVETPGHLHMPAENRKRMARNLQLAEELGASTLTVFSSSIPEAVIGYAREHNITKIVAGKPLRPPWSAALRGSVIDQIIRFSGGIDVYVVSEEVAAVKKASFRSRLPRFTWMRYLESLGLIALVSLAGEPLSKFLDPTNLVMLYLMAVVIAAVFLGRGPAILASLASVLAFDFFFIEPQLSFTVNDTQYLLTFAGLLLVGVVISNAAALLRDQVEALQLRNRQNQAMNRLSRDLAAAFGQEQVMEAVIRNVSELFGHQVIVLLPEGHSLVNKASTPGFEIGANEMAVAEWAFKNGEDAGWGTDTLPAASIRYLPLKTVRGTVGVLGIMPDDPQNSFSPEQRMILEGFANLSALAIERALLAGQAARNELLRNKERLQEALLNSISHELRTPLASITGVLTSLTESEETNKKSSRLDATTRLELLASATEQARQLNRLVENLLNMTRLEAGAVPLNLEAGDIQDLIGTVVDQLSKRLEGHPLQITIPDGFPLVTMDVSLAAQAVSNLLDNACKYSPTGSPIEISVGRQDDQAIVSVKDQGVGIPPEDLERVFDKFYRVPNSKQTVGTGLGLSISKGFVEALGGKIWAVNNPDRGVTVTFTLPIQA
jgi:two-component system, OmpR family, sensor histidine kinase KdpD